MKRPLLSRGFAGIVSGGIVAVSTLTLITAAHAAPVIDPDTGHSYELIDERETWPDARDAAAGLSDRLVCYLATITSDAENDFVLPLLPPGGMESDDEETDVWIGGEQLTNLNCEGSNNDPSFWGKWVTGEAWSYTNWAPDSPDDCSDPCLMYAQEFDPRQWDEEDCGSDLIYLVECEPVDTPVLSRTALIALASLMAASSALLLRRRRARPTSGLLHS